MSASSSSRPASSQGTPRWTCRRHTRRTATTTRRNRRLTVSAYSAAPMSRAALLLLAFLLCLAAPARAQSVNLLTNASFEQSSARGWSAYGGGPVDVSTGTAGGAREGARYGV